jgi:succinate dehydrogenase / fumarate reductase cytochrome b subunit
LEVGLTRRRSIQEEGKQLMRLLSDSIGRKVVMAITGLLMVLFVVGHLLGNLSIFAGADGINTYAAKLHSLPVVVWITRVVMLAAVAFHIVISIQITLENRASSPTAYAVDRKLRATFAGRNMIWTGLILGAFVVYHLFHFTVRSLPGTVLVQDGQGRFDVFAMVSDAFRHGAIAIVYVVAMLGLFFHLSHGIQSTFQSLGLNNPKTMPGFNTGGRLLSVLFLVGYGSIPVLILVGLLAK